MKRLTCLTMAFVCGGLLMAQTATALELSTPAFKQGDKSG